MPQMVKTNMTRNEIFVNDREGNVFTVVRPSFQRVIRVRGYLIIETFEGRDLTFLE